jgi:mRNA interferase MazF
MNKGEIYFVQLPPPPGGSGREQAGYRPVIVATSGQSSNNPVITVIPLTSQLNAQRFAHAVRIDPSPNNGLSTPSIAMVFQLTSVDRSRIVRKVGELEQNYLDQIDQELRQMLSLP